MPRIKFHTLTEQMLYILLCLHKECYGMDILDKVPASAAVLYILALFVCVILLKVFDWRI